MASHIKKCKEKGQRFPEELILNWFVQIVLALKYIHGLKILHRDLKASNLFLSASGSLKIGDFGIAKVLEGTLENAQTMVGTPYYMSPEIIENKPYQFKSDVWSLGCILYELCTLEHTFKAANIIELIKKILNEVPEPIPSCYSRELQEVINLILNKNPLQRPSIDQLLQVNFMKSVLVYFLDPEHFGEFRYVPNGSTGDSAKFELPKISYYDQKNAKENIEKQIVAYSNDMTKNSKMLAGNYTSANSKESNEDCLDEYLTPLQRLRKKKESEARKREDEIKHAMRNESKVEKLVNSKSRKFEHMRSAFDRNLEGCPSQKSEIELRHYIHSEVSEKNNSIARVQNSGITHSVPTKMPKVDSSFRLHHHQESEGIYIRDFCGGESQMMNTIQRNLEDTLQSEVFENAIKSKVSQHPAKKPIENKTLYQEKRREFKKLSVPNIIKGSDDFPSDFEDLEE